MQDIPNILRQFSAEGATHLYSSPPSVLTPADLYRAKHDVHYRDLITGSNIYLITARPRVLISAQNILLMGRSAHGHFLVMDEHGVQVIPFRYDIPPINASDDEDIEQVLVAPNGTCLIVITASRQRTVAAHMVASTAESDLQIKHRDMQVLYVGQGIGKVHARTAVDRLLNHTTLQRILAETSTNSPELEISLLLYRFEHGRTVICNGGDFNIDPTATDEQEAAHFERLRKVSLNRNEVISLAEAALINHFKPHYNTQLKSTNFAASQKIVALKKLLAKGITGLTVEISTANLNARLGTPAALPMDLEQLLPDYALEGVYLETDQQKQAWAEQLHLMAHTHLASFALTTPQERETFMHGMVWLGETEREQLWPLHGKFE